MGQLSERYKKRFLGFFFYEGASTRYKKMAQLFSLTGETYFCSFDLSFNRLNGLLANFDTSSFSRSYLSFLRETMCSKLVFKTKNCKKS